MNVIYPIGIVSLVGHVQWDSERLNEMQSIALHYRKKQILCQYLTCSLFSLRNGFDFVMIAEHRPITIQWVSDVWVAGQVP